MDQKLKVRNYCFTVNNYDDSDIELIRNLSGIKYCIFGKEIGEEGTPHLQCYVMFKSQRYTKSIVKILPGHISIAKGSPIQNFEYCSKENDFEEIGCRP